MFVEIINVSTIENIHKIEDTIEFVEKYSYK